MKISKVKSILEAKEEALTDFCDSHHFPLLFATISGAHLYGFPSDDSDFDLRGAHCIGLKNALSLKPKGETVDSFSDFQGMEMDLVTHDIKKFIGLMLKRNGYVLEQLLSPLVVATTPFHDRLIELAPECITRHHANHYLGFARNQWKLFSGESDRRVKPLLYCFRVLLTGIHLMKSGKIEANLSHLNEEFQLDILEDLMAQKIEEAEKCVLRDPENPFYLQEFQRLETQLKDCYENSKLPDNPTATSLNDLLLDIRMDSL